MAEELVTRGRQELEADDRFKLHPPAEFPFPFQPYDIQKAFMDSLYGALERGNVGIFESPTGTGKSLSLICGALQWFQDHEKREREKVEQVLVGKCPPSILVSMTTSGGGEKAPTATDDEPDWFTAYDEQKAQQDAIYRLKEKLRLKAKQEERLRKMKREYGTARWRAAKRTRSGTKEEEEDVDISKIVAELERSCDPDGCHDNKDDDIVVAEYFSDEEAKMADSSEREEEFAEEHVQKIYYCSRTHSQLAQFVREVQKSPFRDSVHVVTLGSRQNLCINEEVTRLKSLTLINDRCLEMQKSKKKEGEKKERERERSEGGMEEKKRKTNKGAGCPFYNSRLLEDFRDLALAEVRDIEQLVTVGRDVGACPYYGTRRAIPAAQLVVLPYNTLLHSSTREAVGVKLKGNIVIIDEAHNLLDTISSIHSVEITGASVAKAHSQLSQYLDRYRSRLKAKNLLYISQILHILSCFIRVLEPSKSDSVATAPVKEDTKLHRLNDFLFASGVDNVNFFKVLKYCERSQIARKLNGFIDRYFDPPHVISASSKPHSVSMATNRKGRVHATPSSGDSSKPKKLPENSPSQVHQMKSPLMLIESFLGALTNTDKDGRIVVCRKGPLSCCSLKYLLLNPSLHFASVVQEARAVIVTGGTMQPVSELKDQLLTSAGVSPERIIEFSCGHVIPPDNLLPLCLCKGPSGVQFDFTFNNRNSTSLLDELGRTLTNLCAVVPGGVVCFFPSYDYEKRVYSHWTHSGVLEKIGQRKQVFREPKMAAQVDTVLGQYTRCIEFNVGRSGGEGVTGALMLCVVGGKLSEGINFSDDLGRCIVMVGLPYPNIKSPELNEKIEYLNANMPRYEDGRLPGQVHYENLCMKAVNQSIGRAIRHSMDFASIFLLDHRYARDSVRGKLPGWITSELQVCGGFGQAFAALRKFFVAKKKRSA